MSDYIAAIRGIRMINKGNDESKPTTGLTTADKDHLKEMLAKDKEKNG